MATKAEETSATSLCLRGCPLNGHN
ncbi:uncharacterized protein METZ01_LOCUS325811, partial [marine metagenome]